MPQPANVTAGQVITAAHINNIKDSIFVWPDHVNAGGNGLSNVSHVQANASALPSTPTAGTIAIDSADANKLKWHDGSSWKTPITQNDVISTMAPITVSHGTSANIVLRNTNNKLSITDYGWSNATQWVTGTGLPSNTNTAYTITEYTDGVYQNVRLAVHKGGNISIGSATDAGTHKLQVTGDTIFTGTVRVTGSLQLDTGFSSVAAQGASPLIVSKQTDGTTRTAGLSLQWSNASQWFVGTGSPNATNTNFSLTEYTDGAYQGVRLMVHKGGNVTIGTTTDGGFKLEVNGPVSFGVPKFAGTNTTGSASASLGNNSPATVATAPYTWIEMRAADGSTCYIPAWK